MAEPKRITVRVSNDLHRRVKIKAAQEDKSISDLLREWLRELVKDDPLEKKED